ncbi:MAG: transcription termination factor Rho [Rhodospirillaceae bacterium]|nr:MAG: transcription termination factor Rho [Rhodospirillaceae bacterium]
MHLQELKKKTPAELLIFAEELEIENASSLRKQDMLFAILKQLADRDTPIYGDGVLEILQDGFGFLRRLHDPGDRSRCTPGQGTTSLDRCTTTNR